jgi:tetratricopeptide (TPR) repeat protein
LQTAREILLKQGSHQHYWTELPLLHLADLQIRAGDFDGALRSLQASTYDSGRNAGLIDLAQQVARHGNRERAFRILRLAKSHGWCQDSVEDSVQLPWIEYLIASGDLRRAHQAVRQLKSKQDRVNGRRILATAYARAGNATRAADEFTAALDLAGHLQDDLDRAWATWEIAGSQLSIGKVDAARETIRRLLDTMEIKAPWATFLALQECAVLAARANDRQTARRLFRRAIRAQKAVNDLNKLNALKQVAVAQAGVGYVDDALRTARMIQGGDPDDSADVYREEALCGIALAQLKAKDTEGALRTAQSIKNCPGYHDDAIHKIVDYQVAKRNLPGALKTANLVGQPSRKAVAILKVATAYATSGDSKTAAAVAARIRLKPTVRELFGQKTGERGFDYRRPASWGVIYEEGFVFTMSLHFTRRRHAAEVAGAAMTFAQALRQRPAQSYATLFKGITSKEVICALARAHAASGDAHEALAWASRIGSSDKIKSIEDRDTCDAVERRVHALLGVAEGILDAAKR